MRKPSVGILSMQRVINYGSFLQAYALKQLLKQNGAGAVYFIDIIPGRILVENSDANKNKWIRYAKKLIGLAGSSRFISRIKTFLYNRKLTKTIETSWPMLDLQSKPKGALDLIVIGSDEVFNCCQGVSWGYTTQLFGDMPKNVAKDIISYAGSFGYTDYKMLKSYNIDSEVATHLNKLKSISVRDENSASIVERLTGKIPFIHVDPVLAYGYENEIAGFKEAPFPVPYMVVYSYQGRINDKQEVEAIRKYAKDKDLKLVSVFCRYDWCDMYALPDTPIEVLRWFKYADCIVTDTFHGTIFSIITESRFVSLLRPSNKNKLGFLLKQLGLSDRASGASDMQVKLSQKPDYKDCNSILALKRAETNGYLERSLKDI